MSQTSSKLVRSLLKGNIADAAQSFDRAIRARIAEALNVKKVEVAKTLVVKKNTLGENAKGVTFHMCPECESNFKSTQLVNGKLPKHNTRNRASNFELTPCDGAGQVPE